MKDPTPAPIYCILFPAIVEAGRKAGYAITVHGSLQRDLDLVAVPWTNEAVDAKALVDAVMEACTGYLEEPRNGRDPMLKPHGRLAWSIHIDAGAYVDLSVMPKADNVDLIRELEWTKEVYRGLHIGGCRMLSLGDECNCFLCQIDREITSLKRVST